MYNKSNSTISNFIQINLDNKTDKDIVLFVLNLLNIEYKNHKYFTDGVSSRVLLLNNTYLIKQSTPFAIKAEIQFLSLNPSPKMQKIIYYDPSYRFAVYEFIHGDIMKTVDDIDDFLYNVLNITKNYKTFNHYGFGYLYEEEKSWENFLLSEIEHSYPTLVSYIPDKSMVKEQINIISNYKFSKKLIHGDFGTHNFIKVNGKFAGVIDPMPIIGDSLYDTLFAIVSNASVISKINLPTIYNMISEPYDKIKSMLIVVLYSRIARCLKYHKQDIDIYMHFWNTLIST